MQPPTEACTGYWYNVNIKTPTAGPAWKCISQAEYNTVMAQQAHDDQVGGMLIAIIFLVIFGGAALTGATWWIRNKLKQRRSGE